MVSFELEIDWGRTVWVLFGLLLAGVVLWVVHSYVPVVVYLAAMAWMEGRGWAFVGLFAGVSFVVVDVIPDLVVRLYVSGGGLHTGSLMFAYILGPLLFGWYGLLALTEDSETAESIWRLVSGPVQDEGGV